jgi:cobalamin biosynthesis Co2+ chelatase CbiK
MELNELANGKTTVMVAGEEVEVDVNGCVKDVLKKILEDKGIDSFTILVDGKEITSTADLPATFVDHEIEVQRYVKAG